MNSVLRRIGQIVGVMGILLMAVSVASRLAGNFWLAGFATGTLLQAGIGAVTVAPYSEFGWDPNKVDLWDDLFERKLLECADRYYRGRQVEQDIGLAQKNAQPQLAGQLKKYAGEYGRYFEQLAEFQAELLKKNRAFVRKDLPKEPEMDGETCRALLARFTTL